MVEAKMIGEFRGEYSFLSNFHSSPIMHEGQEYPTVEHLFQAVKTLDPLKGLEIFEIRAPDAAPRQGADPLADLEKRVAKMVGALADIVEKAPANPESEPEIEKAPAEPSPDQIEELAKQALALVSERLTRELGVSL